MGMDHVAMQKGEVLTEGVLLDAAHWLCLKTLSGHPVTLANWTA
jgi:hypothetical protein